MKIITISGVDGSGKSTQIEKLKSHLESHGEKAYYFHAIAFSVANQGRDKITQPGEKRAVTKASWHKIQMRKIALLIDFLRFEFLVKKLNTQHYTYILSDRYFYDSLINICFLSENTSYKSFGVELLAQLVRHPEQAYYLEVSADTILGRDRHVEQGEQYLTRKIGLYKSYAPNWGIRVLDGNRTIDAIQEELISYLN